MAFDFSRNHFELFDFPQTFDIDGSILADKYRKLQSLTHPDRYANASDKERRLAVQAAAHINEAYQVLKEPQSRARYLLSLKGVAFNDETDTAADPEFLMQQMELREALEEVEQCDDPFVRLDELSSDINQHSDALIHAFKEQFQNDDTSAARETVLKMRFLQRLQSEAHRLAEKFEDQLL